LSGRGAGGLQGLPGAIPRSHHAPHGLLSQGGGTTIIQGSKGTLKAARSATRQSIGGTLASMPSQSMSINTNAWESESGARKAGGGMEQSMRTPWATGLRELF